MKRFFENTLISGAFSKALRVVALLCVLLGVSTSVMAKTLYINPGGSSLWEQGGAWFGVWAWEQNKNGVFYAATKGSTYYEVNVPDNTYAVQCLRMSSKATTQTGATTFPSKVDGENDGYWNKTDDVVLNSNNLITITGWNSNNFTLSTYTPTPVNNTYCISVWKTSDKKEYARATFEETGTANKLQATFTISNYTGNTSDYQFWVGKNNAWEEGKSANVQLSDYITSCSSGKMSIVIYSNSSQTNYKPQEGECIGGGGGGSSDATADFDCNNIEIWCKGAGSWIDMHCYAWNPDDKTQEPLGIWYGSTKQGTGVYNGATYAVWSISGYDKLQVIFNDGASSQTIDIVGLTKGHRYIYDLPGSWRREDNYTPTAQVIDCSGNSQGELLNGTIFMDLSAFTDWAKDGALFKAVVKNTKGETTTYDLVQCTSETNIYFIDEVLNLTEISKVTLQRINPADGTSVWNNTGEISFVQSTPCIKITNWDGSYSLTTYSGACGVLTEQIVYLSKEPLLSDDKSTVTMYGFLGYTFCTNITEWGFVYTQCTGSTTNCAPTKNSPKLKVSSDGQLLRGESFELTTSGLPAGYTYGYKAYVKIEDFVYVSAETGYFTLADCTNRPVKGSPLTYTVNAALGEGYIDDCNLTYGSLETAIKSLKNSYSDDNADYQYVTKNGDSYDLNQDVTINVHFYNNTESTATAYTYQGTTIVASAGTDKFDGGKGRALLIEDINRTGSPAYTLTIKAANENAKPWIHHPLIRNSRNVVLDGLFLVSDPTGKFQDNALEMDINTQKWNLIEIQADNCASYTKTDNGTYTLTNMCNANIMVQNCVIGSAGFTGVHISGYDGVTFQNNEFEAVFTGDTENDINYGASAKFMSCKNVKFVRNNFRGDHATLLWIQECQNVLFMNNVFWNTNQYLATSQTPAAIRLVSQFGYPVKNLGFYYNTFFFANYDHKTDAQLTSGYDFLAFSNTVNNAGGSADKFVSGTIDFMYNNCYSYDEDAPGTSSKPLLGRNASDFNFCPNNFWSEFDKIKDNKTSAFDFAGCGAENFVNVKENVCETTATGPKSLVVSGGALNKGSKPDISKTGISLTDEELYQDRLRENVRPEEANSTEWTLGAYQQTDAIDTDVIIWQGEVSEYWDDRNNWIDASTGIRLSCINNLSNNLKVIIPQAYSTVYPTPTQGVRNWPQLPSSFNSLDRAEYTETTELPNGIPAVEQVNAGTSEMFAETIELEYGAALKGVEYLTNGKEHYSNAIMGFNAMRKQWILVGTVIMPKDATTGEYRNIVSGDYYIANQEPHVYMRKSELVETSNGIAAQWQETFADLNVEVAPTTVFAIQLPDQYGKYKLPAQYYQGGNKFNPNEEYSYTFTGKFVNDAELPNYTGLTAGTPVLLNNSYPCNIDAKKLEEVSKGKVQYYDYTSGTFMNTSSTTGQVLLKPQHGFIFTPAEGEKSLQITTAMLAGGDTKSRDAELTLPTLSVNLFNANTGVGYSNVVVKIDNMLAEGEQASTNVEKVFAPNEDSPELYIMANNEKLSRLTVSSNTQVIPLGVRLKKDMNIKFKKEYFNDYETATLVDTHTGKETDLLRNSYTTETLLAGEIEGRFFLNVALADNEFEEDTDTDNGNDDTTTDVDDAAGANICVYVNEEQGNLIKVVAADTELQTIYVSDMTGRTQAYNVSGNYANLRLPVAQGVYLVQVIGDNATKTEKVILK